ncbi:UDP-N-acetylmuramate dehydrogenase [Cellulosilyticum ruminicola]|uniref:UDP-N-acetylmuramate dehydrogenase n=1 Tax=Cellulosilyticum ruminicola TaxID=425254 RepID=UPI0006D14A5C|nr:UDP-N-acetylmuramate dehydrogenase [Cellulosilyticum ruminicola]
MDINLITEILSRKILKENILINEPMKKYTTFRVGGPADIIVKPSAIEEIQYIVVACKENNVPYYIIGNGSNLLVDDLGFRGVIIQVYKNLSDVVIEGTTVRAQAGALLSKIATKAADESLTGFEFAHGIPGTLGGAVTMNAGAYGGEIKDVIVSAKVMNQDGKVYELSKESLELGYRKSIIEKEGLIVLEVTLDLAKGKKEEILATIKDFNGRRRDKQPLDKPSAGSTFKRPVPKEGEMQLYAGKLIEDSGLRGFRIGGAAVSDKHCGFVVNEGGATFEELTKLIKHVQDTVQSKFGVYLETEVKVIKN